MEGCGARTRPSSPRLVDLPPDVRASRRILLRAIHRAHDRGNLLTEQQRRRVLDLLAVLRSDLIQVGVQLGATTCRVIGRVRGAGLPRLVLQALPRPDTG